MRKHIHGSMTVEAALGLPVFVVLVFFWIELCVMVFSMSMIDHVITTSVIEIKKMGESSQKSSINYQNVINRQLSAASSILGINAVDKGSVSISVKYIDDFYDLKMCDSRYNKITDCPHVTNRAESSPLAIYSIKYDYKPLVSPWFPKFEVKREIMAVQEYERCEFKFGKGTHCA